LGKPEIKDVPMPRKIRDLVRDLVKAGFEERRGKGSHRNYSHPLFAEVVTISGKDGSEDVNQWRKATVDVMSTISLRELADDPAAMLDRVEAGEHILVVREGRPVAELRPVAAPHGAARPFGLAAGTFTVPDDFDSPLPSAILREFEGR
jgi:antitoxin (DNA-binding transcriptional repressor) of toxin-antitoxin stability system/predicted RNA binding protein YcfA (HicA-like mRNA interferase family)